MTKMEIVMDLAMQLDRRYPGWASRVNPATIEMSDCVSCVIGQAAGADYDAGYSWQTEVLALTGLDAMDYKDPRVHAFACSGYKDAWIAAIAERVCALPSIDQQLNEAFTVIG